MKGKVYIEYENGNIELVGNVDNDDYVRIVKGRSLKEKVQFAKNDKLKDYFTVNGGFINFYYGDWIDKLDPHDLFRFLYLATNMDYDRSNGNLIKHGKNNRIESMNKKDIKQVMNMTSSTFTRFMSCMMTNDLIIHENEKYYINSEYVNKGKARKDEHTRVFVKSVRYLYENTEPREHKTIGRLYQLGKYTNKKYNIICTNPDEKDIEKIVPISLSGICEILNAYNDKKTCSLFYHKLNNYVLTGEYDSRLFKKLNINNKALKDKLIVNPKLFYSGGSINSINLILDYLNVDNYEKFNLDIANMTVVNKKSKGEEKIEQYLNSKSIEYIPQKKFIDLVSDKDKLLPYDFYLVNKNIIIEFDGKQHDEYIPYFHKTKKAFEESVKRDKLKDKYAKDNRIKLIRIKEFDYENIESILDNELN